MKNQKKLINKNDVDENNVLENEIIQTNLNKMNFQIIHAENFQFLKKFKKSFSVKKDKKHIYYGDRKFTFPGKFVNISCNHLYIMKNYEISIPKHLKRVYVKIYLIFIIYFVILLYLMIMIQNIQTKYGNKFIELCILPFFNNLLVKYLFTFNIMMLITSFLLY